MDVSDWGMIAIARHEGIALGPYRDSGGIWTSGLGHTSAAGGGDPGRAPRSDSRAWPAGRVEQAVVQALTQFRRDLAHFSGRVTDAIQRPLLQHQFDALVSFDFNTGGIARAKLSRQINDGDLSGSGFLGWQRPQELLPRRRAERALFLTGDYRAGGALVPLYDSLGDGRLQYRTAWTAETVLALMPPPGAVGQGGRAGQGGPAARLLTQLRRFLQVRL